MKEHDKQTESTKEIICALCGEPVSPADADPQRALSDDHLPPKQFYPKSIRPTLKESLWKVPTHKSCNNDYKLDEEYFFQMLFPLVHNANSPIISTLFDEIKRRAVKPQTQGLIRRLLSTGSRMSPGGLALPPGMMCLQADEVRLQRIAIKIAQEIYFRETGRFVPRSACIDIRLCEQPADAIEIYRLTWSVAKLQAVDPSVFGYHYFTINGWHIISMLFWQGFMFCVFFVEPGAEKPKGATQ